MSNPFRSNDPTTFDDVDGIIIDETAPPPNVIGVAANIAALIGRFQRGPANVLTSIGSIGEFHEVFGKSAFSGNKELRNKKFGSLRIIRAVASDAAKADVMLDDAGSTESVGFEALYEGVYGNSLQYKVEEASGNLQRVTSITCVADSSDSLDRAYFLLADEDGSVAFWIDTDDSGSLIPAGASAADRAVEITTIVTDDSAPNVATKIAAAIHADSKFTASALSSVVTVTNDAYADLADAVGAGDSGFTVSMTQEGADFGRKYTFKDANTDSVLPLEVYDRVSVIGKTQEQLEVIFAQSAMIAPVAPGTAAVDEPALVASFTSLTGGSAGTEADTDYETSLAIAEAERSCNVLWCDKYSATIKTALKAHLVVSPNKMVVMAPNDADLLLGKAAAKAAAIAEVANLRDSDGRIIYAFNGPKTFFAGVEIQTSPAAWVASVISNTSPHIDPAFVENVRYTAGATGLQYSLTRQDYIDLMAAGIASFENDPDYGIKLRSGIVTQIANSSKLTILRRRMADFLTDSVGFYLKNYQNAPNTANNRRDQKAAIIAFDDGLINAGLLPSDAEVNQGLARLVDSEVLNTDLSIGLGFAKILYKRRIYSSMRFIVLQAEIGETVVVTESEG